MHIAIVSGILHPRYGGPSTVVRSHVKALVPDCKVNVFGVAEKEDMREVLAAFPGAKVAKNCFPKRWFRGCGLQQSLLRESAGYDVFHGHMVWDFPLLAASRASQKADKPLVITPHGSISGSWRYRSLHKKVYRIVVLKGVLKNTDCIHVLNPAEEKACREFGITCRIEVIPNGIDRSEFERPRVPDLAYRQWPELKNRRVMLYLGRIWSGKGLGVLVEQWACLRAQSSWQDWLLVIAGPDYKGYRSTLEAQIEMLGVADHVKLIDPVEGELKMSLFAASEAFVLPSFGEGFSMALLEAAASGLPALYTRECNFPELALHEGGWEIPLQPLVLKDALSEIVEHSSSELKIMGGYARAHVWQRYTLDAVGESLKSLYRSLSYGRV